MLLMADQMRWDCLGITNPAIKTPNLDRLTSQRRALPACLRANARLPAMSRLGVTGQYPSTHGATHNRTMLDPQHPQLMGQHFRDAGYWTHFIGKSHLSWCHGDLTPEGPRANPPPRFLPRLARPVVRLRARRHQRRPQHRSARLQHALRCVARRPRLRYLRSISAKPPTPITVPGNYPRNGTTHDGLPTRSSTLDGAASNGQPFLINANFQDPHNPCMVPEPWASMYDPKCDSDLRLQTRRTGLLSR